MYDLTQVNEELSNIFLQVFTIFLKIIAIFNILEIRVNILSICSVWNYILLLLHFSEITSCKSVFKLKVWEILHKNLFLFLVNISTIIKNFIIVVVWIYNLHAFFCWINK